MQNVKKTVERLYISHPPVELLRYFSPGKPLSSYTILLGSHLRTGLDDHRITRNVKLAANHEKYLRYYWGYDISVLTLSDSVDFNDFIIPICLQSPSTVIPVSSICYSTGWGLTDYNQSKHQLNNFTKETGLTICISEYNR